MNRTTKTEWLIPAGLLALCAVPAIAGAIRVVQLSSGAEITPENSRFFEQPLPVVLHIFSSLIYCIVGAFQFSPGVRRRAPR